jgi:hypothetical protein
MHGEVGDEVDERELSLDTPRRHVSSHRLDPLGTGLLTQAGQHGLELSMPRPRSASGSAIRPVPIANSRAAPSPASSAGVSTAGATTVGSNIPAECSW